MRRNLIVLVCLVFCGFLSSVRADNINVSYTASGTPGDLTLNFSVNNNLIGTTQNFYFFGVNLDSNNIIAGTPIDHGSSTPWFTESDQNLTFSEFPGGGGVGYNDIWVDEFNSVGPGSTTSGFEVEISDLAVPLSVEWFAFTNTDVPYCGGGNFNGAGDGPEISCTTNPGFQGFTFLDGGSTTYVEPYSLSVPEPSSLILCAAGVGFLIACAAIRRTKLSRQSAV
jgi:hypothetical protein